MPFYRNCLVGDSQIHTIPILPILVRTEIYIGQAIDPGIQRMQDIARGQAGIRNGNPLLHPPPIRPGHDSHTATGLVRLRKYGPEFFLDGADGGGFGGFAGPHFLGQRPAPLSDGAVGQLLVGFEEGPIPMAELANDSDGGDVEGSDRRGGVGEGGLALIDLEPEVVDVLGAGSDPPGSEGVGRQARPEPVGEGLRGGEDTGVIGFWVGLGHGGGIEEEGSSRRDRDSEGD